MDDTISVHVTVRKPEADVQPLETKVQPKPDEPDGITQVKTVYTVGANTIDEARDVVQRKKLQDDWDVVSWDNFEKK